MNNTQLTRSGVAYDFTISPHKYTVRYSSLDEVVFIFSSELYKNKFIEKLEENRKYYNESLSKRFGFEVVNNKLCDLKLYLTIEKRGFLIKQNAESYECLSTIKLDGQTLTQRN